MDPKVPEVKNLSHAEIMQQVLQAKVAMLISNLSFAQARSRNGIPDWRINNVFDSIISDYQAINAKGNSSGLLQQFQDAMSGTNQVSNTRIDKLEDQFSKAIRSLDSLHHRLDDLSKQATP